MTITDAELVRGLIYADAELVRGLIYAIVAIIGGCASVAWWGVRVIVRSISDFKDEVTREIRDFDRRVTRIEAYIRLPAQSLDDTLTSYAASERNNGTS